MNPLRVVVLTPFWRALDVLAAEVEFNVWGVELRLGPSACPPMIEALSGGTMVVRSADGAEAHVAFGRGSLVVVDGRVSVMATDAAVRLVRDGLATSVAASSTRQ